MSFNTHRGTLKKISWKTIFYIRKKGQYLWSYCWLVGTRCPIPPPHPPTLYQFFNNKKEKRTMMDFILQWSFFHCWWYKGSIHRLQLSAYLLWSILHTNIYVYGTDDLMKCSLIRVCNSFITCFKKVWCNLRIFCLKRYSS